MPNGSMVRVAVASPDPADGVNVVAFSSAVLDASTLKLHAEGARTCTVAVVTPSSVVGATLNDASVAGGGGVPPQAPRTTARNSPAASGRRRCAWRFAMIREPPRGVFRGSRWDGSFVDMTHAPIAPDAVVTVVVTVCRGRVSRRRRLLPPGISGRGVVWMSGP